jgi:hypothetical protein
MIQTTIATIAVTIKSSSRAQPTASESSQIEGISSAYAPVAKAAAMVVMRTTASVGSWMVGSGTLSIRTSRLPCHVSAFNSSPSVAVLDLIGSYPAGAYPSEVVLNGAPLHKPALIPGLFTQVPRRCILRGSYRAFSGGIMAVRKGRSPRGEALYGKEHRICTRLYATIRRSPLDLRGAPAGGGRLRPSKPSLPS